jgi:hypothetical protein
LKSARRRLISRPNRTAISRRIRQQDPYRIHG